MLTATRKKQLALAFCFIIIDKTHANAHTHLSSGKSTVREERLLLCLLEVNCPFKNRDWLTAVWLCLCCAALRHNAGLNLLEEEKKYHACFTNWCLNISFYFFLAEKRNKDLWTSVSHFLFVPERPIAATQLLETTVCLDSNKMFLSDEQLCVLIGSLSSWNRTQV